MIRANPFYTRAPPLTRYMLFFTSPLKGLMQGLVLSRDPDQFCYQRTGMVWMCEFTEMGHDYVYI